MPNAFWILLGTALANLFSTCVFHDYPSFDVPSCSSQKECTSLAGAGDLYTHYVGVSWYYANSVVKRVDAARKLCAGRMDMNEIIDQLSTLASQAGTDMLFAVKNADSANLTAIYRLAAIQRELNYAGVSCLPESRLAGVQNSVNDALLAIKSKSKENSVSKAFLEVEEKKNEWMEMGLMGSTAIQISTPLIGTVMGWSPVNVTLIQTAAGIASSKIQNEIGADEYINMSVGLYDSVYKRVTPLFKEYEDAKEELDKKADEMKKELEKIRREILKGAEDFSSPLIQSLEGNILSEFIPKETVLSYLPSDLDEYSAELKLAVSGITNKFKRKIAEYRSRKERYLCIYAEMEALFKKLKEIKKELEERKNSLGEIAEMCREYIKSYSPYTEYARIRLKGIWKLMASEKTLEERLALCAEGVSIILEDREYKDEAAMLENCEEKAKKYSGYYCEGDIIEKLTCCQNFVKKKISELHSSDLYKKYLETLSKIEELVVLLGIGEREYLSLNRYPETEEELKKLLYKALDLYEKLRKEADGKISPVVTFEGYLDASEVSEVNMLVYYGVNADILYTGTLPFDVYAYKVLESNGMEFYIKGNEYRVEGGGYAKVRLITYPYGLEEEKMGCDEGYIYLKISNNGEAPVKRKYNGEVIAYSGLVHWDGEYIYFEGPGKVLLRERAIDVEVNIIGGDAYVTLKNLSDEKYTGSVTIPVSGSGPSYCPSFGKISVCSVQLDPYEKRVIVFRGAELMEEDLSFEKNTEVETSVSLQEMQTFETEEKEEYEGRMKDLITKMKEYYKRAREIGAEYLLPFDENTIDTVEELSEKISDPFVLSTLYSVVKDTVNDVERRAKYFISSLEDAPLSDEDKKALELAKKSLASGDYVLALAIADTLEKKARGKNILKPEYLFFALSIIALALMARKYAFKQKKKPIPWI